MTIEELKSQIDNARSEFILGQIDERFITFAGELATKALEAQNELRRAFGLIQDLEERLGYEADRSEQNLASRIESAEDRLSGQITEIGYRIDSADRQIEELRNRRD